jgi:hypothetical protein
LVQEPDILDRFGKAVQKRGLIGETNNAKILYLTLTSRLFERPVSVVIKGVSSGGKSFTVETVLGYFPDEAFFARTGMSEHALPYSEEDFQHRHVVVYEAVGLDSETASYFIRTLLSENRICYETVEKTSEGLKSRVIKKDGPTGLITTTTATALHPENETRLLSLGVIDSPEQTKAVMRSLADRAAGGQLSEDDHPAWQAFQQWLAAGERRVVVPYAAVLAEHVPPAAVRLRRDFATLMSLIAANALLHRDLRPKDDKGRIQATVRDYEVVQGLVATLFAEGVEATVPPTVRTTVEAVKTIGSSEVSIAALAKHLGLDKSSVRSRIRKAIDRGYLTNNEPKQGLPARITLGDPLPNETQILPSPDVLRGTQGVRGTKREG